MLRYCIFTDEITGDFERALDVAQEYGIKHVELRGVYGQNVSELNGETIARAKAQLDRRGMRVASIAGPVYKCYLYPAERKVAGDTHNVDPDQEIAAHLRHLDHCIEVAHAFGTNLVRTFAFWRQRDPDEHVYRDIVAQFQPALERAKAGGVVLALENEHACFIGSAAESIELLRRIESPHLGLIWDPGNAYFLGEQAFPDGYERIKREVGLDRIVHVHVKDARKKAAGGYEFCALGEGAIDFGDHFERLLGDGWDGAVSIETHYQRPGGTKEDASRESLAYLRAAAKQHGFERDVE